MTTALIALMAGIMLGTFGSALWWAAHVLFGFPPIGADQCFAVLLTSVIACEVGAAGAVLLDG